MIFKRGQASKREIEVVFLRGFPRSGTNWVCNLLNLHPEIFCTGEFHLTPLFECIKAFKKHSWSRISRSPSEYEGLQQEFYEFIKRVLAKYGMKRHRIVCDRTPNVVADTFIPGLKHLIISRDGRDCLVSWFYHCFRYQFKDVFRRYPEIGKMAELFRKDPQFFENNPGQLLHCEGFFRERARLWNDWILKDKQCCNELDKGGRKGSYLWIQYEELHSDPEKWRNEIYFFLSVDVRKAKPLDPLTSPGFEKHDPLSHYRIGAVGGWKKYFFEEAVQWFDEEAGEALHTLGYQ